MLKHTLCAMEGLETRTLFAALPYFLTAWDAAGDDSPGTSFQGGAVSISFSVPRSDRTQLVRSAESK